jgi:hypothetical protein
MRSLFDIVFVYPKRVLMGFLPIHSFVVWPYIAGIFERSVEEVEVEVGCRVRASWHRIRRR